MPFVLFILIANILIIIYLIMMSDNIINSCFIKFSFSPSLIILVFTIERVRAVLVGEQRKVGDQKAKSSNSNWSKEFQVRGVIFWLILRF